MKTTIKIKALIKNEVSMGTFGLVELELLKLEKEIEELKKFKNTGMYYEPESSYPRTPCDECGKTIC